MTEKPNGNELHSIQCFGENSWICDNGSMSNETQLTKLSEQSHFGWSNCVESFGMVHWYNCLFACDDKMK